MEIIVMGSYLTALVMEADRIPLKGETLVGRNFRQTHGGKGSNQAVQAARLGAKVSFYGAIGNDAFGQAFLELCKNEKIDASGIHISKKLPTGVGFIICGAEHNIITIDIGALNEFDEHYINSIKHLTGKRNFVLIQQEVPLQSALCAAKTMHEAGHTVILNPAPACNVSNEDLSYVDIYTPNETEARVCLGLEPNTLLPDQEIAEKLLNLGCKNVVITLGDKGCLVACPGMATRIKPYKIPQVVDSTGAGDSFNAALAVALSEGKNIIEAARFANAVAALSCTKADTIPSFPTRNEVNNFLKQQSV